MKIFNNSSKISVIDLFSNTEIQLFIKESDKNREVIILYDDTLETIKQKIFLCSQKNYNLIHFIPQITNIYVKNKKELILLNNDTKSIVEQYGFFEESKIYIESGIYEFPEKDIIAGISSIHSKLVEKFPKLTLDIFKNILKLKTGKSSSFYEQYLLKLLDDIKKHIILERAVLKNFPAISDSQVSSAVNFSVNSNDFYDFSITNIIITTDLKKINDEDNKIELDLKKIFDNLELSLDIPYISTNSSESFKPYIKIYKGFKDEFENSSDILKSWMINEQDTRLKIPKGLLLKIKKNESDTYNTLNIFSNGKILIRCGWTTNQKMNIKNIHVCYSKINTIIDFINSNPLAFISGSYLPRINSDNIKISSLNSNLTFNIEFNKNSLKEKLSESPFNNFFSIKQLENQNIKKDSLSLNYLRLNNSLITKEYSSSQQDTISLLLRKSTDSNKTVVNLYSGKTPEQSQIIFEYILLLLFDTGKILNETQKTASVNVQGNLKMLKTIGVNVNSVKCQKGRQPIIIPTSDINKYIYTMPYKTKTNEIYNLACDDSKGTGHKYPGIMKNIEVPCCYKKDQRTKPEYINFVKKNSEKIVDDIDSVLDKNIQIDVSYNKFDEINFVMITTDKILEYRRIGVLSKNLNNLFNFSIPERDLNFLKFVRFGNIVSDNNYPFYHAFLVNYLNGFYHTLSKKMKINSVQQLIEIIVKKINKSSNLFKSLGLKNIKKESYIEILTNPEQFNVTQFAIPVLLSFIFKVNIFIFETTDKGILCNSSINNLDDKYNPEYPSIFFHKHFDKQLNKIYFEPIVLFDSSENSLKFFFYENEIINISEIIKDLYDFSCIGTPQYNTEYETDGLSGIETLKLFGNNIKYQYINDFNELEYLIDSNNLIIPVIPSSNPLFYSKIKAISLEELLQYKKTITQTYNEFKSLEKIDDSFKPVSQILSNSNQIVTAIVLSSGLIVPVEESKRIPDLSISSLHFSETINSDIFSDEEVIDKRIRFISRSNFSISLYHQLRLEFADYINSSSKSRIKENIISIISKDSSRSNKFNSLFPIILEIVEKLSVSKSSKGVPIDLPIKRVLCNKISDAISCDTQETCYTDIIDQKCRINIPKKKMNDLSSRLVDELIRNGKEIINNKIQYEIKNIGDDFVIRPTEVLLFNIEDVLNFLK